MLKHTILHKLLPIFAMLTAFAMQSCGENDEPAPPSPTRSLPSRTVLVYMVSNNNLGTNSDYDIKEMINGCASPGYGDSRVIIFHKYRYTENGEQKIAVQLNEIKPYGIDTLKIYDNDEPAVTVRRMRQVIADVKEIAPALSYGMVFWSHASGWLQDGIQEDAQVQARSFGSDEYGYTQIMRMSITSLHDAVYDADLDFMYFDCCYMGSVETVYELRDCAPYIICSPAEIPADGMPYHTVLPILTDASLPLESMAKKAAQTTFDYYDVNFKKGDCPNTMCVVRTSALDNLASATRLIYDKATTRYDTSYNYQKYSRTQPCYYYDLEHYVESICTDVADMDMWRATLAEVVVYADASPWLWNKFTIDHYSGLSTYILNYASSATTKGYNTLSWYADVASALL